MKVQSDNKSFKIDHITVQNVALPGWEGINKSVYGYHCPHLPALLMETNLVQRFWKSHRAWDLKEEFGIKDILPSRGGIAFILFMSVLIAMFETSTEHKTIGDEVKKLNSWSTDMIQTLEDNPFILHPTHPENLVAKLFPTDGQKAYVGLHEALRSLPQWWTPLVVWFLVVYVKQMKLERLKDTEVVFMTEEADASGLQRNSNMSYSIVAEYDNYIVACIDFDDIEFFWPPRAQHGKARSKENEDKEMRLYGGLKPGNLVQIEVRVRGGEIVTVDIVVAERNYSKEGRRPKSYSNVVMGTARVRQIFVFDC